MAMPRLLLRRTLPRLCKAAAAADVPEVDDRVQDLQVSKTSAATYDEPLRPRNFVRGINFSVSREVKRIEDMREEGTVHGLFGAARAARRREQDVLTPAVLSEQLRMPTAALGAEPRTREELAEMAKENEMPAKILGVAATRPESLPTPAEIRRQELRREYWTVLLWTLMWMFVGSEIAHRIWRPDLRIPVVEKLVEAAEKPE
eukprot:TRINITY_DN8270_c0_g1_i1.p2 TRINITY_DN8270_c0_g1~~TRINITY_DN8270_c0_g1_i1.p2  ORF type:complete len:222 (+),score=64.98 TRINITY_DN8270_c0_g1_i1:60-668(+)